VTVVVNHEKYDSNTDKCPALFSVIIATIKLVLKTTHAVTSISMIAHWY